MEFDEAPMTLKPLHKDAIKGALAKAERYRLLNEPAEAESICLDAVSYTHLTLPTKRIV